MILTDALPDTIFELDVALFPEVIRFTFGVLPHDLIKFFVPFSGLCISMRHLQHLEALRPRFGNLS